MTVWVVIQYVDQRTGRDADYWSFELQGVFTTEEKALDAIQGWPAGRYGLGPVPLDEPLPMERLPWPDFRWMS